MRFGKKVPPHTKVCLWVILPHSDTILQYHEARLGECSEMSSGDRISKGIVNVCLWGVIILIIPG